MNAFEIYASMQADAKREMTRLMRKSLFVEPVNSTPMVVDIKPLPDDYRKPPLQLKPGTRFVHPIHPDKRPKRRFSMK